MKTRIIEATNGPQNWGKFLLGALTVEDRQRRSVVDTGRPLFAAIGYGEHQYLVLDLQTGEGAMFRLGGLAHADLEKHKIWVCPLFEPFLEWLYASYREAPDAAAWWDALPPHIDLPDAPFAMHGYRREGATKPPKDCQAAEWQRDGRGLWAMRACRKYAGHDNGHDFGQWRSTDTPAPAQRAQP